MIWLPGDEEFDSVDNVRNNVGGDDDDEGNEDGSRGREESDDDSDASSSIEEMRNGGVNGRGNRELTTVIDLLPVGDGRHIKMVPLST